LPGVTPQAVRVIDGRSGRELVSQLIDETGDGKPEALLFQADFAAKQTVRLPCRPPPASSGWTTLRRSTAVRPHANDDFAWESDRIGYRVYGPALRQETVSNGIDVWLKRVRYPIIEKWYQPGADYHADHGEGADLFKVGPTLGCGATAVCKDGKIHRGENFAKWRVLADGPVRTLFELEYDARPIDGGACVRRDA